MSYRILLVCSFIYVTIGLPIGSPDGFTWVQSAHARRLRPCFGSKVFYPHAIRERAGILLELSDDFEGWTEFYREETDERMYGLQNGTGHWFFLTKISINRLTLKHGASPIDVPEQDNDDRIFVRAVLNQSGETTLQHQQSSSYISLRNGRPSLTTLEEAAVGLCFDI